MSNFKSDCDTETLSLMPSLVNIETSGNHIYFYDEIDESTILKLNKIIQDISMALVIQSHNGLGEPCIYLHINSGGGSVMDALSAVDTILRCPVKVVTIVEGCAASAATLLSGAGHYRLIAPHALMLIHQLSSGFWGKHNEFEDEMQNLNSLMKIIKEFYQEYTEIPTKTLDELLKHDLYLTAPQCVALGLVDGIIGPGGGDKNAGKKKPSAKPKSVKDGKDGKDGARTSAPRRRGGPVSSPTKKPSSRK